MDHSVFLGLGGGRFGGLRELLFGLPALLLQAETGGVVVATAELADLFHQVSDSLVFGGIVKPAGRDGRPEQVAHRDGEMGRHPVRRALGFGDLIEAGGFFAHVREAGEGFLVLAPIFEAAPVPFREVLLEDGTAFEFLGQDLLDLGEGVEPLKEFGSGLAVLKAGVELFAESVRETGDFTGAHGVE
jgi:hypothetical protein